MNDKDSPVLLPVLLKLLIFKIPGTFTKTQKILLLKQGKIAQNAQEVLMNRFKWEQPDVLSDHVWWTASAAVHLHGQVWWTASAVKLLHLQQLHMRPHRTGPWRTRTDLQIQDVLLSDEVLLSLYIQPLWTDPCQPFLALCFTWSAHIVWI